MRSQTVSGTTNFSSEGQQWPAQPVDATGWLAPPPVCVDGPDPATATAEPGARRAGNRRVGRGVERSLPQGVRRRRRPTAARNLTRLGRVAGDAGSATDATGVLVARPVDSGPIVARPVRARSGTATEGYRMGRWTRLLLTATVLAAVVVISLALTAGSAPQTLVDVTVGPGDTLWSIATSSVPDRDPRAVIEDIRQMNDLPSDTLPIGVVLRVPVSTG